MALDPTGPGAGSPDVPAQSAAAPASGVQTTAIQATLLQVKSNDMLEREAAIKKQEEAIANQPAPMSLLASFIESRFRENEQARRGQTDIMMDALRRRAGTYDESRLAEIKRQGGSEVFIKLTEAKCATVEALMVEVLVPEGERPFNLKPTPKPTLPDELIAEVVQETMDSFAGVELETPLADVRAMAKKMKAAAVRRLAKAAKMRANNMANLIDDEFTEGGYYEACEDVISDAVALGTGVMKGPFLQMERTMQWGPGYQPDVADIPMMKWKRVDPMYLYPSKGAVHPQTASNLCEVDEFTRLSLYSMIGIPGWKESAIRAVLQNNKSGVTVDVAEDSERAVLEGKEASDRGNPDDTFKGIWYSGECYGDMLRDWGLTGVRDDEVHEIIALKIANEVVHLRLNPDPLHRRQYTIAKYKTVKGSFWGQGVPILMSDIQDNCNATGRHLINNLAVASGPQAVIRDVEQLAEGQNPTSIYPWKVWQFNDPARTGQPPIQFTSPDMHAQELMEVYKFFLAQADERIGVPQYAPPSGQAQGAAGTATGLSILLNQSSRVIRMSIRNFDRGIHKPNVQMAYTMNMLTINDSGIKGDVRVVASGALGIFVKEQQQLRVHELLRLTANPIDLGIMRTKGRAVLLRKAVTGIDVGPDEAVPSEEEMEQADTGAIAPVATAGAGAPASPVPVA
jgi:hypothetical protein